MRAAALSVCDYITHFIALFSNYEHQSRQALLQQITMEPHYGTVSIDDDVVTIGAVFESPLLARSTRGYISMAIEWPL